jgi:release factor glutamine methyltransferase|tara:strand:+ start:6856 stop:7704 length:849 start_codon:yes stop_codon:yes gene_type:complete
MDNTTLLRDYLHLQLSKLEKTDVQESKNKSEMIILHYLKISKADLYLKDIQLNKKNIKDLNNMFDRLASNAPVQHIIEETFFYEHSFLTPPGIFIPRPETELIVDCALDHISVNKKKLRVLDLCTGSGCIILSIAKKFPENDFIGIDSSNFAIQIAKKNKKLLNVENVEFVKEDIFNLKINNIDLLVCNPPYLAKEEMESLDHSVKKHDPENALTDFEDGTSYYKFLISNFQLFMNENGIMLIELPYSPVAKDIELFNKKQNVNKSTFLKDLEGKNRVIKIY